MSSPASRITTCFLARLAIVIVFGIIYWNSMSMRPTQDYSQEWPTQDQERRHSSRYIPPNQLTSVGNQARRKARATTLQAPVSSPFATSFGTEPRAQRHLHPHGPVFEASSIHSGNSYGASYQPHLQPTVLIPQPQIPALPFPWSQNAIYTFLPAPPGAPGLAPINPNYVGGGISLGRPNILPRQASHPPTPQTSRRGLPQKPKRSGLHTVWVGNIPNLVNIIWDLKDHFSQDATTDIESVFLIRRSNCAFVNYRTEEACTKAVSRFNQMALRGARLLCRLKRPDPADDNMTQQRKDSRTASVPEVEDILGGLNIQDTTAEASEDCQGPKQVQSGKVKERFFILKSLTEEDLLDSRRKGTWITQPHVQESLHDAYQTAETVYLVFSVNKSREYFGYAKMKSSPFDDLDVEEPSDKPLEGVHTTATPATETAPAGKIVEDPARDTLFWEAVRTDIADTKDSSKPHDIPHAFKIEWCRRRSVPFQRVRGLKNTFNNDKEVKVARDGTELEGGVAQKVIELFDEEGHGYERDFNARWT